MKETLTFFVIVSGIFALSLLPDRGIALAAEPADTIDKIIKSASEQAAEEKRNEEIVKTLEKQTGTICWMIEREKNTYCRPLLEKLMWHPDVLKVIWTLRDRGIVIGISGYRGDGILVERGSVSISPDMAYYMSEIRKFLGLNPYWPYWEYK
ncbi:MAG: hypothetical protein A3H69_02200 [Candidatus Sungbacteria bacterium RIFCSPLOWO2_02_FULL_47_9]|uniref:Uncharacterized protein n=1 Tax=Candidatus Sungbacteria bacterium RIFCSPHIGHO2_01_FULL_47_32 TaxID=1802264 RepID=A0A1G2K730_9BACT|nr:MAG: hypothetical protein UX72_C0001G0012 [Parcubacteria group bacterium GW2011_GWA2_47_10]OGZ94238.1 MAG: hypothetical protein A2633_05495 [Candidatus Sungbacteria bacterium RIFCSPHIGHO2_01_FULL_47_32]OGZ99707.1 MAG: hypothetical protein A3D57_02285 [Candidatus Sungbacteria bacterium RIFCSPHIGHO2_02_FULL_46_12]OHA05879.1 MAG: hypothetical protein A3A28_02625 [Candidatus Sungbacteria bacterium RIFCSPLOWO2_01_FULL_47_32]OHA08621.1 MAG: hypothetical protein A3H69_02200 [Candidatus Sungbacteria